MLSHPSGRPWVVGRWGSEEITEIDAGPVHAVLIGFCASPIKRISALLGRIRSVADADGLSAALHGSFHLVVSVDGCVRVQGSLAGLRRVFHAQVRGVPVAADRADVLAAMAGSGVDERMLAVRVACGSLLPPPLGEQSMWREVHALPPDHYLKLEPDRAQQVRWWNPPEPDVPLHRGAATVRETLIAGMAGGEPADGRLSADLSGGMDSTSLCFLAARETPDLLSFRWSEENDNGDGHFAAEAAHALQRAEHLVVPRQEMPGDFAEPGVVADFEQPYPFPRTAGRTRHTARVLARHGVRRHLAGYGGDELFYYHTPAYLHRLLVWHPLIAIRHIRGYRALRRWPLIAALSALVRPGDVATWWRTQADQLTDSRPPQAVSGLGWGFMPLRAPAWATADAVRTARAALRETAEYARPLAGDPGQHQFLQTLRSTAVTYQQLARLFTAAGIDLRMPYLDDRVVEATLAIRLHERATPLRYKPLLCESMRGIVPNPVIGRSTKGGFGEDVRTALRRHLADVQEVVSDSALAAQGLVDPEVLRARLQAPSIDLTTAFGLDYLLSCETWFRSTATLPGPGRVDGSPAAG